MSEYLLSEPGSAAIEKLNAEGIGAFANPLIKNIESSLQAGNTYQYSNISIADATPSLLRSLIVRGYCHQNEIPTPTNKVDIDYLHSGTVIRLNGKDVASVLSNVANYAIDNVYDDYDIITGSGTRRTDVLYCSGTEDWIAHSTPTMTVKDANGNNVTGYIYKLNLSTCGTATETNPFAVCNYLRNNANGAFSSSRTDIIVNSILGFSGGGYIFVVVDSTYNTVEKWKTFLASVSSPATTTFKIIYKKATETLITGTPVAIALTQAENTISNDNNVYMSVTYNRDITFVGDDSYTKTESDSRYIKDEAGSVSGSNIEAGAVTEAHIANDAVTGDKIAPDSVDFFRLQDNAVITNKILDGAVTTAKLDDDSVTTDKIANAAVTSLQIATGAVTINKILNNSVSEEKLRFDSVSTSKLQNLAVTTDKIADAAVTKEKISSDFLSEIDKKYANALIGEAVSSESSGGDYEPITLADANPVNLLNLYVLGYAYQASVPTPSNQSDIQFLSGTTTVYVNSQQAAQFTDIINYAFGKNYDFVDIVSGQGEKNIGRMEFDGTESWAAHSTPTIETADGGTGYVYRLSNADFGTAEASSPFAMCNYLRSNPKGTFSSSDAGTVLQNSVLGFASGGIIFVVTSFPTLDEWKAFLQQKAQSPAAKVYVIYKKAAPSSVSITPTEVAVNAGSVVSNSKNRRMYIRYNRDINSVIQQLTQAIAASAANI